MPGAAGEMTDLEYPFTVQPLGESEGGGYLIEFPDLPGCMSDGETPEEAIRNGADAVRSWIDAMQEAGRAVPAPSKVVGARTVSVPDHLYQELLREAERAGLSLDAVVDVALVRGISVFEKGREETDARSRVLAKGP